MRPSVHFFPPSPGRRLSHTVEQRLLISLGAPKESKILRPSAAVLAAAGAGPIREFSTPPRPPLDAPPVVYELRTFMVHPGVRNVPFVLDAFAAGCENRWLNVD
jgi:hypothetical protein